MIREDESGDGVSYWPSVSDLFMTLFIIAVALIGVVLFVFLPGEPTEGPLTDIDECNRQYAACQQNLGQCAPRLQAALAEIAGHERALGDARSRATAAEQALERANQLIAGLQRRLELDGHVDNDKPPIITIDSDILFTLGGTTISDASKARLGDQDGAFTEIADTILARNANDLRMVDTLEIIGHTDGVPMRATRGNLDAGLREVLAGDADIGSLRPGSNNDLGLVRALAIKQTWQAFVAQFVEENPDGALLKQIDVRTYSAGQTIPYDPDGPIDDERSRRIELRLTKLR